MNVRVEWEDLVREVKQHAYGGVDVELVYDATKYTLKAVIRPVEFGVVIPTLFVPMFYEKVLDDGKAFEFDFGSFRAALDNIKATADRTREKVNRIISFLWDIAEKRGIEKWAKAATAQ